MEHINAILFYIIAIITILSSCAVIFSKKIMNAVFSALICFFCFAFLYFSLNAPFNGAVQMSIYAIALTILFTIAVMLTNYKNEQKQEAKLPPRLFLAAAGLIMITVSIIFFLKETMYYEPYWSMYLNSTHILTTSDNIKQLSSELLTHNIYSFELLGLYLLIVLIGISVLLTYKGETK